MHNMHDTSRDNADGLYSLNAIFDTGSNIMLSGAEHLFTNLVPLDAPKLIEVSDHHSFLATHTGTVTMIIGAHMRESTEPCIVAIATTPSCQARCLIQTLTHSWGMMLLSASSIGPATGWPRCSRHTRGHYQCVLAHAKLGNSLTNLDP